MLTTLQRVLDENKASDTNNPLVPSAHDVAMIMTAIRKINRRVFRVSFPFEPYYATKYFTAWATNVNSAWGILTLKNTAGQQLLLASATDMPTIVSDNVTLTFGLTTAGNPQVIPFAEQGGVGITPIRALRLNWPTNVYCTSWYPCNNPFVDSIAITGWWGYSDNYATAWVSSGDSVVADNGATITVSDSTQSDAQYYSPRFSPGNLIRIENELMQIQAIDVTRKILSVLRAQNGTTQVAHAVSTPISVWYPQEDVMDDVSRAAAYAYAKRGAYETVQVQGVTNAMYARDPMTELLATLQGYNNE